MSSLTGLTSTLTTLLASIVASFIAVEALLAISNQLALWLVLIGIVYVFVAGIESAVKRRYQRQVRRGERPSEDMEAITRILAFIDYTIIIVLINLAVRIMRDEMAVTEMDWDDYIIMGVFAGFVVFIVFQRMAALYLPANGRGDEF